MEGSSALLSSKRLTRSKSAFIRERLIVQNVSHGLEKLRKSDLVMQAVVGDPRPLFEEMVDRGLNRLRTAQHAYHVLLYGDEVFELARRLPFADSVLRGPLYWHSQLYLLSALTCMHSREAPRSKT